ncbi:hypothetical protein [Comamonas testosteroni]|uniref:hypothetical protein n=1 Tax=Comamonas testosteroni TaxID=285 RepID=UPI0012D2C860|nr:hypothetical protein [Comamonas testosteroni]
MSIRRNRIYFFRKSGNKVQTLSPTTYGGRGSWIVRRVDGASAGKEMIVPGRALMVRLD